MKRLMAFVLGAACFSCSPKTTETKYETTGDVYIRTVKWDRDMGGRVIVVESPNHAIKTLTPLCQEPSNVWQGMRAEIGFHWNGYEYEKCYEIDWVKRLPD